MPLLIDDSELDQGRYSRDFTDLLIDQLAETNSFIKDNATNRSLYINLARDPGSFKEIDVYPNYANSRYVAKREDIPKIDLAAATIRKPIRVFRDVLVDKKDERESTYIEHYLGLSEYSDGRPLLVYVLSHRNLLIKLRTVPIEKSLDILEIISGLQIYGK